VTNGIVARYFSRSAPERLRACFGARIGWTDLVGVTNGIVARYFSRLAP
jgi:hypothetical protein